MTKKPRKITTDRRASRFIPTGIPARFVYYNSSNDAEGRFKIIELYIQIWTKNNGLKPSSFTIQGKEVFA